MDALAAAVTRLAADPPPRTLSHLAISIDAQSGEAPVSRSIFPSDEPDGFVRDWRPNLMPPEKHLAYAIQWFMITATVIIIYVTLSVRAARRTKRDGKAE